MVPFMSGMELSLKFVSVILGNERERERGKVCVRVCVRVEVGVGFEFVKHSLRFH